MEQPDYNRTQTWKESILLGWPQNHDFLQLLLISLAGRAGKSSWTRERQPTSYASVLATVPKKTGGVSVISIKGIKILQVQLVLQIR